MIKFLTLFAAMFAALWIYAVIKIAIKMGCARRRAGDGGTVLETACAPSSSLPHRMRYASTSRSAFLEHAQRAWSKLKPIERADLLEQIAGHLPKANLINVEDIDDLPPELTGRLILAVTDQCTFSLADYQECKSRLRDCQEGKTNPVKRKIVLP